VKVDEVGYLHDVRTITRNIALVADRLDVKHLLWFPFGMGAFMRNLGQIAEDYRKASIMQRLRRRTAYTQLRTLLDFLPRQCIIHLSLREVDEETRANTDAFIRAIHEVTSDDHIQVKDRIVIDFNSDMSVVATELARTAEQGLEVMLVNASNTKLLGNQLWTTSANIAIEENLHRRSVDLACAAYAGNNVAGDDLGSRISRLGVINCREV
jgi:hypothetical protein